MPFVLTLYARQVLGYSALKFGISPVVLALGATAGAIAGQALMAAGSLVLTQVSRHGSYFPDIFRRAALVRPRDRPGLRDRHGRGARWGRRGRGRARLGPEQHRLADRHSARRRHRHDRCRLRSQHYLTAHKGVNPLAALTEGYQSAFLACAVLAGIGLALAFLLPRRPRKPAHELPEPDPAGHAAAAGDVVIRSGTK
jgi:hypothetical protein